LPQLQVSVEAAESSSQLVVHGQTRILDQCRMSSSYAVVAPCAEVLNEPFLSRLMIATRCFRSLAYLCVLGTLPFPVAVSLVCVAFFRLVRGAENSYLELHERLCQESGEGMSVFNVLRAKCRLRTLSAPQLTALKASWAISHQTQE